MSDSFEKTTRLIKRLQAGDLQAVDELIEHSQRRLRRLVRRMLRGYPVVGRHDETDDILQEANRRLLKALRAVTPTTARHFYNLAAQHIRWILNDLARRYENLHGTSDSDGFKSVHQELGESILNNSPAPVEQPEDLAEWTAFHAAVDQLPDEEREVVRLVWYLGIKLDAVAAIMELSLRTVKRRWRSAKETLRNRLSGPPT